jgi:hypothetical protein
MVCELASKFFTELESSYFLPVKKKENRLIVFFFFYKMMKTTTGKTVDRTKSSMSPSS